MKNRKVMSLFIACGLSLTAVFFCDRCNASEKLQFEFRPQKHANTFEVRELKSGSETDLKKTMLVYLLSVPVNYFDGKREGVFGVFSAETRVSQLSVKDFKAELYCVFRLSSEMTSTGKKSETVSVTAAFDISKDTVDAIRNENFAMLRDQLVESLSKQVVAYYDMLDQPPFVDGTRKLVNWLVEAELSVFPERVIRAVTLYDETIAQSGVA